MPTYEYACTSCSHRFDAVQSFSDAALTTCPVCDGPLRKIFGNVGIVLKGSGFYKTDSRSGTSNGATKASKESSTPEGSSDKNASSSGETSTSSTPSSTSSDKAPASSSS